MPWWINKPWSHQGKIVTHFLLLRRHKFSWASSVSQIQPEQVSNAEVHARAVSSPDISPPWPRKVAESLLWAAQLLHCIHPLSVPLQSKMPHAPVSLCCPAILCNGCLVLFLPPHLFSNETKSLSFDQAPSWRMIRLSFSSFFHLCAYVAIPNSLFWGLSQSTG